jgi:hypothetical protein
LGINIVIVNNILLDGENISFDANWVGHILRRNCLLKYVIEGMIERTIVAGRLSTRRKQLLGDLKEKEMVDLLVIERSTTISHYLEHPL